MTRHIALFVVSPYRENELEKTWVCNGQGERFIQTCRQTNETAIRYLQWYLEKEDSQLDCAFALVTKEEGGEKFTELFDTVLGKIPGDNGEPDKSRLITVELSKGGGLQGAFESACKLVDELKKYLGSYDEMKNVTVHFDMTGGPRHDVMLLMALIQLLRSYGITIGKVLYGNLSKNKQEGLIEDVAPVMDMYTLISGVEEFRQYASAKILQEYFSANNWSRASDSLKTLITKMQVFSENIKLCVKFRQVNNLLKSLDNSLNEYEIHTEEELSSKDGNEEKLFAKLLPSIKASYSEINTKSAPKKRLAIIRWCVTHGLIQQATTFYTEWFGNIVCNELTIGTNLQHLNQIYANKINNDIHTSLIRYYKPGSVRLKYKDITVNKTVEEKQNERRDSLTEMFRANVDDGIRIKKDAGNITQEDLINVIVNEFIPFVETHRNTMNHAKYLIDKNNQKSVGEIILDSLKLFG